MFKTFIRIFNAKSLSHLVIIFLVFGITGSLSVFISEPILNFAKLDQLINYFPLYIILKILVIFAVYQASLLAIATLFGEFHYFKNIQKKFLKRMKIIK